MTQQCEFETPVSPTDPAPLQEVEIGRENNPSCVFPDTWKRPIDTQARQLLGGKGAEALEMTGLGFPVPPLFIVPTDMWSRFRENGNRLTPNDETVITQSLQLLENISQSRLGDSENPLLVSVRSSPRRSMPGQLETVINLGLNKETEGALGKIVGEEEAERLLALLSQEYPENPHEQILLALSKVFRSWDSPSVTAYRVAHYIPDQDGPAAIIQQMVWGNSTKNGAGSGVFFPRHPQTYEDKPYAIFEQHAQGPSVVEGDSTEALLPISNLPIPESHKQQLIDIATRINRLHRNQPYEGEITDDGARLWLLQKRSIPRIPIVELRYRQYQVENGILTPHQAKCAIPVPHLEALVQPILDPVEVKRAEHEGLLIGEGIPLSGGCAKGKLCFSIEQAMRVNEPLILVDPLMTDFSKLPSNVRALLQLKGGIGSHAAKGAIAATRERSIPVVFGVAIDPNQMSETNKVTVDASGNIAKVFLGDIPYLQRSQMPFLSVQERRYAKKLRREKTKNPWAYLSSLNGYPEYQYIAQQASSKAQTTVLSEKAREYVIANAVLPPEIRQPYSIIKRDTPNAMAQYIRPLLDEIFANGNHATLRTCHNPRRPANGPWVLLRDLDDFNRFRLDRSFSKYGNFDNFLDPDLTELLLGEIPPGKMEDQDKEVQYHFGAWILSALPNGLVILQVYPHNAHLRTHEPQWKNGYESFNADFITNTTHYNPGGPNELSEFKEHIGAHLKGDYTAHVLSTIVRDTIFKTWWESYQLPLRMAAITGCYKKHNTSLEGQVHTNGWCQIYGIKPR